MNIQSGQPHLGCKTEEQPNAGMPTPEKGDSTASDFPKPPVTSDTSNPNYPFPGFQIMVVYFAAFGFCLTFGGSCHWWMEQYYKREGIRTNSGVVIAKWKTVSKGGEGDTTYYHLRYSYTDHMGRIHRRETNSQNDSRRWDTLDVGSKLPTIEFLESAPGTHRFASEEGQGPFYALVGLLLLLACIPLRMLHVAFSDG